MSPNEQATTFVTRQHLGRSLRAGPEFPRSELTGSESSRGLEVPYHVVAILRSGVYGRAHRNALAFYVEARGRNWNVILEDPHRIGHSGVLQSEGDAEGVTPVLRRTGHFIRSRRERLRLVAQEVRLQVLYLPLDLFQPIQSVAKPKGWNVREPPRVDEEVEEHDAREAGEGHIGHPRWGIRLQKAPADDPCKDSSHDVYAQEMPPTCHRETSPPRSG